MYPAAAAGTVNALTSASLLPPWRAKLAWIDQPNKKCQAKMQAMAERMSKVEKSMGRALEMQALRLAVDEAGVAREKAQADAASARVQAQVRRGEKEGVTPNYTPGIYANTGRV